MGKGLKAFFAPVEEGEFGQLVQIYGRRQVFMEGCKQVLHCDDRCIRIRGRFCMTVEGEGLVLKEMGDEVLCAQGHVSAVRFEE